MARVSHEPPPDGFYWFTPADLKAEDTVVRIKDGLVWFLGIDEGFDWGETHLSGMYQSIKKPE